MSLLVQDCWRRNDTKLNNCIDAVRNGVSRVHILDGRLLHCLLLEFFTNKGIGTAIISDEAASDDMLESNSLSIAEVYGIC